MKSRPRKKKTGKKIVRPKNIERSVLDMTAKQAQKFFLKASSYCRIELPPYFDFTDILRQSLGILQRNPIDPDIKIIRSCEGVNYTIYSNKDGRYAWRPFQVIHPLLYVSLVQKITESSTWEFIIAQFVEYAKNPKIRCISIPSESLIKRKDQGVNVNHWWQGIEQASIDLALDYNYLFHADISDCYPSVYTHSIAWAFHSKPVAKLKKHDKKLIGNVIDFSIQNMQQGQTNGIPQGSVLFDFIAESVLGYADLELSKRLEKEGILDYQILRYRDDYRVFVNSPQLGELILKYLSEILMQLGLKLNASKTTNAQAVIYSSIKKDKLDSIRSRQSDRNLQKHLFIIHTHSTSYPNAGSLIVALDRFYSRLLKIKSYSNVIQLISITVDIAFTSPRCIPICAAIMSKLIALLKSKKEKLVALTRIRIKLSQLPNNGHLEIWLQRISYQIDSKIMYKDNLCQLLENTNSGIWNNDWVSNPALKKTINPSKIINRNKLKKLKPIVPRKEISLFSYDS